MTFESRISAAPAVQCDDSDVRITRWEFGPGAVTGQHRHQWPYVVVMLTDAVIRVDDGSGVAETHLPAGQAYHRPAGIEHDVMNGGDQPLAFVEIEFKRPQALVFK